MKTDGAAKYLFFLMFLIVPLFFLPQTYDSFFLPKFVLIKVMCILLLCVTCIGFLKGRAVRLHLHPINLGIALFTIVSLISGICAQSLSLWMEEMALLGFMLLFCALFQSHFSGQRQQIITIALIIVITADLTALWVLFQDFCVRFSPGLLHVVPKLPDWRGYLSAGFGNTNHIADYVAFAFIPALFSLIFSRSATLRGFMVVSLTLMYASLIVCFSVSSNAGLIIALLLMFMCIGFDYAKTRNLERKIIRRLVVTIVIFAAITLSYVTDHPLNPHRPSIFHQAFGSQRWKTGGSARLAIWANTLEMIKEHTWLGVGAGNFTYQYVMQKSPLLIDTDLARSVGKYTNAAHNEILQIWSEVGIFGVAFLGFAVICYFRSLLLKYFEKKKKIDTLISLAAMICMVVFVLHSQMNFTLQTPAYSLIFFMLLCVPIVLSSVSPNTIDLDISNRFVSTTFRTRSLRVPEMITIRLTIPDGVANVLCGVAVVLCAFGAATVTKPLISDYHYKRARTFQAIGLPQTAEEEYLKALQLNPHHSDCRSAYGSKLFAEGRYEETIEQFEIVKQRLQASEVFKQLGDAHSKLGNEEKAFEYYEKFFEISPFSIFAYPEIYQKLFPPTDGAPRR